LFARLHQSSKARRPRASSVVGAGPLEDEKNSGIALVNAGALTAPERTTVVMGAPRCGPTVVAAALQGLGVFMGSNLVGPVYEDVPLSEAVERDDDSEARRLVAERNAVHDVWD